MGWLVCSLMYFLLVTRLSADEMEGRIFFFEMMVYALGLRVVLLFSWMVFYFVTSCLAVKLARNEVVRGLGMKLG